MFNIFSKNKIISFEKYLEKEQPHLYSTVKNRLSGNYKTERESLFKAVEYYVNMLRQQGHINVLVDINFLEEEEKKENND